METAADTQQTLFEELDYRESDGIEVSLLWNRSDNSVAVFVVDAKMDVCFELPVGDGDALHAFNHPFAYAARIGVATDPVAEAPTLA